MNSFRKIKYNDNQAFTLIELIVVIAIISIILAFAIPRLDMSFFSNNKRKLSSWIVLNVKSLKEKAIQAQTLQVLNVDLDKNQMWTSSGPIDEKKDETEEAPADNVYKVPSGYRLIDVELLNMDKATRGIARIRFYRKGYSDKALIHVEDNDNVQYSYLIEPFLPNVKIIEKYIEF